jgi:hypothetical protein
MEAAFSAEMLATVFQVQGVISQQTVMDFLSVVTTTVK